MTLPMAIATAYTELYALQPHPRSPFSFSLICFAKKLVRKMVFSLDSFFTASGILSLFDPILLLDMKLRYCTTIGSLAAIVENDCSQQSIIRGSSMCT